MLNPSRKLFYTEDNVHALVIAYTLKAAWFTALVKPQTIKPLTAFEKIKLRCIFDASSKFKCTTEDEFVFYPNVIFR